MVFLEVGGLLFVLDYLQGEGVRFFAFFFVLLGVFCLFLVWLYVVF